MLAIAENIFQEVEAKALLLNGEVVRRALQLTRTGFRPQFCCLYRRNPKEYNEMFEEYLKLDHRTKVLIRGSLNFKNTTTYSYAIEYRNELQDKLRSYICSECVKNRPVREH